MTTGRMRVIDTSILGVAVCLLAAALGRLPPVYGGTFADDETEALGPTIENLVGSTGALGYYWDDAAAEFVLVVPDDGSSTLKQADLAGIGSAARIESRSITPKIVDQITDALLAQREFIKDHAFGFGFDPHTGKVVLWSGAPKSAFESLIDANSGLIDFRPGTLSLANWSNDQPPYSGGAWLNTNIASCTSGFTGQTGGVRRMVTAGHCLTSGHGTSMGTAFLSSAYPDYDVGIIYGSTYSPTIWDSASTHRAVSTASNPTVGLKYCTSARTTGFKCSWILESMNVTICYTQNYPPDRCAHGLAGFYRQSAPNHIEPGDSGGPLWYKYANGSAGIRGVISGYFFDALTPGGFMSYATQYNTIVNQLGVYAVLQSA